MSSKPRLSARVNPLTHDDLRQLFDARAHVFGLMASSAARTVHHGLSDWRHDQLLGFCPHRYFLVLLDAQ